MVPPIGRHQPLSRVRKGVRFAALDQFALLRGLVVHREHFDGFAGVAVKSLPGALQDLDLVSVLEPKHDVRIVLVGVLLSELFRRRGHQPGELEEGARLREDTD